LEGVLGTVLVAGFLGWVLRDFHTRTVTIGDGRLTVAGAHAPLDAVEKLVHESHIGLFPIVTVHTVGGLVRWPYRKGENEELERILNAVIELRRRFPPKNAPGLRASHGSAHFHG
jgi:hypothetical protein